MNPKTCMNATSNGLHIWLISVVPALFPFFILTRIIISLNQTSIPPLDKFTSKCFNTQNSGLIYFLSLLSGYPIGAKMISTFYENQALDKQSATKMFSFCSTSGPMFLIGTIGIGVFKNVTTGYILLLGHIIGSFLNGLLYRNKPTSNTQFQPNITKTSLNDIIYDSIISILLVGGYIIFASVIIKLLELAYILPTIANFICNITHFEYNAVYSVICGIIEITNGIIMLGSSNINLNIKIILTSALIAFSGICIMLQSMAFTGKIGIKKSTMFLQKFTQAIFSAISTTLIILLFK
jgi:sporulation integral membrane protein YlbJ